LKEETRCCRSASCFTNDAATAQTAGPPLCLPPTRWCPVADRLQKIPGAISA
jgi:hypothetical protein